MVNVPIEDYFCLGNKTTLLYAIKSSINMQENYTLDERLKYGFPISIYEYGDSMKKLVILLNKNFKDKVQIR